MTSDASQEEKNSREKKKGRNRIIDPFSGTMMKHKHTSSSPFIIHIFIYQRLDKYLLVAS